MAKALSFRLVLRLLRWVSLVHPIGEPSTEALQTHQYLELKAAPIDAPGKLLTRRRGAAHIVAILLVVIIILLVLVFLTI